MPERAPSPDPLSPYFRQELDALGQRTTQLGRVFGPGMSVGAGGMQFTDTPDPRRLFRITGGDGSGRYSAVPVVHTITPPVSPPISPMDPVPRRGPDLFTNDTSNFNGPILDHLAEPLTEINANANVPTGRVVMAWPSATSASWEFDCGLDEDDYPYPYGDGYYDQDGGGTSFSWLASLNIGCDDETGNQVYDIVQYTVTIFIRRGRPISSISMQIVEEDVISLEMACETVLDDVTATAECVDGEIEITLNKSFKDIRVPVCGSCE